MTWGAIVKPASDDNGVYDVVGIPVAALGLLSPMLASAAMALSRQVA